MEPTRAELQADDDATGHPSSDDGDELGALSHDEMKIIMGFVENVEGVGAEMLNGPLDIDMIELRIRGLSAQTNFLKVNFEHSGAVECIERAVECRSQALSLTPEGHVRRPSQLSELGSLLSRKFERFGHLVDADMAIQLLSQAMLLTPEGDANRTIVISNLGSSHRVRFEHLGELEDIEKSIEYQSQAVLLTPDGHSQKPAMHNNLGASYNARFERLGELEDIDTAIDCMSQAVLLTPDGDPDKPVLLCNLGWVYSSRFERLGKISDIDKAIEYLRQTMLLTHDNHLAKGPMLNNLGGSYVRRYKSLGELADINEAIRYLTQAVLLTPDDHPGRPPGLSNLGDSHTRRFERLGELVDLDKAIEFLSQAVMLTPDSHPNKPVILNNLAWAYNMRYYRFGELTDIDKAIQSMIQAVSLSPDDHALKPMIHSQLGNSYLTRFDHLGVPEDIDKAIECSGQAVRMIPDNHPAKPGRLRELGNAYNSRFVRFGNIADIDKAIEYKSQAALITPNGHVEESTMQDNLGVAYRSRFERLGELPDIDESIQCLSQALQLIPDNHADKLIRLINLGGSHYHRFEHLGTLEDLDMAIEYLTQAVLLTPNGHAQRPVGLGNPGISYLSRFRRLGELSDIHKALKFQHEALLLTPDGHADKAARLSHLGISFRIRFERLGELTDIDKAIEFQSQAVLLAPNGHAFKPALLRNLGDSYRRRFDLLGEHSDLECAQSHFQRGAQYHILHPDSQIACARNWAKSSVLLDLSPQSAYERCMELLPHLIWLGTTIDRRYTKLLSISDLATEAAAWAVSVQLYDLAIEWLEQGRSIVWNQVLQLRTPFDELSVVDPTLASDLQRIATQLEALSARPASSATSTARSLDLEKDAQQHRHLAAEWEHGIERARSIPGFESFMRPPKAVELKLAAKDGPVVLVNTHSTRWDALIIFPQCDDVAHVPLQLPTNEDGKSSAQLDPGAVTGQWGAGLRKFVRVNHALKPEDSLKTMLVALWPGVVNPILNALACTPKLTIDELPHVTWCATGVLAFAPLHAAGPYDGSSPDTCDLVVSSYTPSLGALRASNAPFTQTPGGIVAIGQENTQGFSPLPNTVQELAAINQYTQAACFLQLDDEGATIDAVLDAMDKHSWVHLACHATQNPINPAHSAFHLHNGNLTLEAITKRQFKNKGLAFLSACQTAQGDGKLPDEAVHLAAGMLMAGYRSVIATMWSIQDIDGPEVAGGVYAELLKDGIMDHTQAARALHKAVAELRKKIGVDQLKRWVPFIHIGV